MSCVLTSGQSSAGGSIWMILLYILIFVGLILVVHKIVKKNENAQTARVCHTCGQYNYGKVNFCKYCGAALSDDNKNTTAKKICPNCGFKTEVNTAFCPNCGKNI